MDITNFFLKFVILSSISVNSASVCEMTHLTQVSQNNSDQDLSCPYYSIVSCMVLPLLQLQLWHATAEGAELFLVCTTMSWPQVNSTLLKICSRELTFCILFYTAACPLCQQNQTCEHFPSSITRRIGSWWLT